MNARHVEERREMFMGQELVYYVTVIDPCPPPSDENPYCQGGRCVSEMPAPHPNCNVASEHSPEQRIPTKVEFVRAFDEAGSLPACVRERRHNLKFKLQGVFRHFEMSRSRMPARLLRALAWYDAADPACVYDAGRIARIRHCFADHQRRAARSGAGVTTL
jgi:hypothetical protein